jgi:hypothetical protein
MVSFRFIFRFGCVSAAIFSSFWPIYLYSLDEDLVQINFKKFHSTEDRVYPSLTFCFNIKSFPKYNDSVLKESLFQIGSNDTTLKIEDYISTIEIKTFENNIIRFSKSGVGMGAHNASKNRQISTNTVLRRFAAAPCFAVGIPFMEKQGIDSMVVSIKKNIFFVGNVPTRQQIVRGRSQFSIGFSYQNQYFPLLGRTAERRGLDDFTNTCSGFIINVRGMEILRRRNKLSDPCNDYANEDAMKVLDDTANKLRCKPQHWDLPSPLPDCSQEQLNESRVHLDDSLYNSNAKRLLKPCRSILDFWYDYDFDRSFESCTDEEESFSITILFNDLPLKEITFVSAHTLLDLLSNISVIIGIFVGASLFQLPDIHSKFVKWINSNSEQPQYQEKNTKERIDQLWMEIETIEKDITLLKLPVIKRLQHLQAETEV